jgi:hypothetical protein
MLRYSRVKNPDLRKGRLLLRARRQWPRRGRGSADETDKFSSPHGRPSQTEDRTVPQRMKAVLCITANSAAHVRFGSGADITRLFSYVRFTPKSGQTAEVPGRPLCAKSGLTQQF